jgi:hypothetical protein
LVVANNPQKTVRIFLILKTEKKEDPDILVKARISYLPQAIRQPRPLKQRYDQGLWF